MKELRMGFTTGSCATAAAKAALTMLLSHRPVHTVSILLPNGEKTDFSIHHSSINETSAQCAVKKDGGDDPDVTHGLMIFARVSLNRRKKVVIEGGEGVGTVTKPGLRIPVNTSAITHTPLKMIKYELGTILDQYDCHRGVQVVISVPGGEEIAQRTFNPKLGITGGISIIGTTGRVKPYSIPAIKKSLLLFLDQAKAHGHSMIVMVPGNIGENAAHQRYILGNEQVVQMSNYVGYMARKASVKFEKIVILGHPGKLLKIVLGCFNTHSQKSLSPLPFLKNVISMKKWAKNGFSLINSLPTVEGIITHMPAQQREPLFSPLASKIERRLCMYTSHRCTVGAVLVSMDGQCIGRGIQAKQWEQQGWLKLQ